MCVRGKPKTRYDPMCLQSEYSGCPCTCSHHQEGLGGCRYKQLQAKKGELQATSHPKVSCVQFHLRETPEGITDCVVVWRGDSLTPHVRALPGFLLCFSHRGGVGRGEDKTSQLNFFLMVWWSVWHVNPHCPCSPAWLQWWLLTNSLPQTGKFCYLAQTCSHTLSSQLHT